jgi:hypothetical protein
MLKRVVFTTFVAILLLLVGNGCESSTPPPPATTSPLPSPDTSPLPTPSSETEAFEMPTPSPGLGNVTGVLIDHTFETPVVGANVYLAPILTSEDQKMEMARFDKTIAIGVQTDQNGRFVFQEITPGRYALILGGAIHDYLLADFRTQEDVVFDLEADQIFEIGEVHIVVPEDVVP